MSLVKVMCHCQGMSVSDLQLCALFFQSGGHCQHEGVVSTALLPPPPPATSIITG